MLKFQRAKENESAIRSKRRAKSPEQNRERKSARVRPEKARGEFNGSNSFVEQNAPPCPDSELCDGEWWGSSGFQLPALSAFASCPGCPAEPSRLSLGRIGCPPPLSTILALAPKMPRATWATKVKARAAPQRRHKQKLRPSKQSGPGAETGPPIVVVLAFLSIAKLSWPSFR